MQSMGAPGSGRPGLYFYEGKTLEEWLPHVVEQVAKRFDPLQIIVFGSVDRGEANYDSDIDLLVVFDEIEWGEKRNVTVEIRRVLAHFPRPKRRHRDGCRRAPTQGTPRQTDAPSGPGGGKVRI